VRGALYDAGARPPDPRAPASPPTAAATSCASRRPGRRRWRGYAPSTRRWTTRSSRRSRPTSGRRCTRFSSASPGTTTRATRRTVTDGSRVRARPVDEDRDAVADCLRAHQAKRLLVARGAEQALAGAEHDGEDHQPPLVDEVGLEQPLNELGAPVHDDVALVCLAQLRHLLREVTPEHGGVAPLRALERRRDDVLRHRVELVGELAVAGRPRRGEALVGVPTEEQRLGAHRL